MRAPIQFRLKRMQNFTIPDLQNQIAAAIRQDHHWARGTL